VLARLSASPNEVTAAIAESLTALVDNARSAPTSRIPVNVTDYSRMPFNEQKVFGRKALTDVDGQFAWTKARTAFSIDKDAGFTLAATFIEANGETTKRLQRLDVDSWPELVSSIYELEVTVIEVDVGIFLIVIN